MNHCLNRLIYNSSQIETGYNLLQLLARHENPISPVLIHNTAFSISKPSAPASPRLDGSYQLVAPFDSGMPQRIQLQDQQVTFQSRNPHSARFTLASNCSFSTSGWTSTHNRCEDDRDQRLVDLLQEAALVEEIREYVILCDSDGFEVLSLMKL